MYAVEINIYIKTINERNKFSLFPDNGYDNAKSRKIVRFLSKQLDYKRILSRGNLCSLKVCQISVMPISQENICNKSCKDVGFGDTLAIVFLIVALPIIE